LILLLAAAAAALLALSAVSVPGAAAQGERPRLLKTPLRPEVWSVSDGQRRWVTDLATFHARGYRWDDVALVAPAALRALPVGPADHQGQLIWERETGRVYLEVDGQPRHVSDVLSFEAYGLEWRRVQPVWRLDRARPAGQPLPHAIAGQPLVALGDTLATVAAQPARPAPAPESRLQAALHAMAAYAPTADWPAFLARYGVTLQVGQLSGAVAAYRASDRTLTVDQRFAGADSRAVATTLVHETVHAIYDARGQTARQGRACIDEEVQAFATQAAFWAQHRPGARPPETTAAAGSLEAELDRILAVARDDALGGTVLTTWAYTLRCYFPASEAPPDT
jgi:hypothetical protein